MVRQTTVLAIRYQGEVDGQTQFVVTRLSDGKTAEPVTIKAPNQTTGSNRANSHLADDLRWYLARFLDDPFAPNTDWAKDIQGALEQWGKDTFHTLFQGEASDWYQAIEKQNLRQLTLKIVSDDASILAWPWEALRDQTGAILAQNCCIERQPNMLPDLLPWSIDLPTDCINILLVIARPYEDQGVGGYALADSLIKFSQQKGVPIRVDVLRPPTFDQLSATLQEKAGFYHIVHLDGQGEDANRSTGLFVFESEKGQPDVVGVAKLTQLLRKYPSPIIMLSGCRSVSADKPVSTLVLLAYALLKAGIGSVVDVGYNLRNNAVQQFFPAFYRGLFQFGTVAEATRAGRQAMLVDPKRECVLGEYPLQDWLVPVLYQSAAFDLNFSTGTQPQQAELIPLPPAATEQGEHELIGRGDMIHALEQTLRKQASAGLLIHGVAGVGKTTLVQSVVQWLQQTNGLERSIFWFRFDEIRNIEYLINQMVQGLFGTDALASSMQQKMDNLCAVFKQNAFIMVWDNFECVHGADEDSDVPPLLTDDDRKQLKEFLRRLRRGKTKIIMTSRSTESWLSETECARLPLNGLQAEQRWQYCNAMVNHLGLTLGRVDNAYHDLMEKLLGHPLAIRVVLLRLIDTSASTLLEELQQTIDVIAEDDLTARTDAALQLLEVNLPPEYTAVLQFIGLHQRYVQLDMLPDMMKNSDLATGQVIIKECFNVLERAGLIRLQQKNMYAIHPALHGYLRRQHPAEVAVQGAFVDFMAHFADHLAPKEFNGQRPPFYIHGANFHIALSLAIALNMAGHVTALTQALAVFARNDRDFQGAERLFKQLANHYIQHHDDEGLASCYHQLGRIAQDQRDFVHAEHWYFKLLAINERLLDEQMIANTYAQLGALKRAQQQWVSAAEWFIKAASTFNHSGDTASVVRVAKVYVSLLKQSDSQIRAEMRGLWQRSGLEQVVGSLDMLIGKQGQSERNLH